MTGRGKGQADEIDVEVGRRLRSRRIECGFNQTELARRLGVTFQQVQKYEKGVNRVSASMLARACQALHVDANYFISPDEPDTDRDAATASARQLMRMFHDMDASRQRSLLSVAQVLTGPSAGELQQMAAQ